jgi:methylated-DNA-[protein]-cysteine S-methyltransferase
MESYIAFATALGWVGLLGSGDGLLRLVWHKPSKEVALVELRLPPGAIESPTCFGDLPHRLRSYFSGERVAFPDRLDLRDRTHFQRSVLELVLTIPYGETRSYAWVAQRLGRAKAFRAVGQVLAQNPLPIIIPCHRVIGSDGGLVGYGSGLELKRLLLRMESSL